MAVKVIRDPRLEAEAADFVVCRRIAGEYLLLKGSLRAECCRCQHPIWYKDNSPVRPAKICDECMSDLMVEAEAKGDTFTAMATSERRGDQVMNRLELLAYWRRPRR